MIRRRRPRAAAKPVAAHLSLGARGEIVAARYLSQIGYRLVGTNFIMPIGRNHRGVMFHAEIDLVAYEGTTLCFVEVKTRASDSYAAPEQNVDLRKQRRISRAARVYRRMFGVPRAAYRYDVVSVIMPHDFATDADARVRLTLLRNFWTDDKFRARPKAFDWDA